jgi:hypothetical protein
VQQFLICEPAEEIFQGISLCPIHGIPVKSLAVHLDLDSEIEKFRECKHEFSFREKLLISNAQDKNTIIRELCKQNSNSPPYLLHCILTPSGGNLRGVLSQLHYWNPYNHSERKLFFFKLCLSANLDNKPHRNTDRGSKNWKGPKIIDG